MTSVMVVLPGGGYRRHGPLEAEPVAEWFEGIGVPASVLRYPVGQAHPAPLDAVRAHVRELRRQGVERVGLCGFSAGGHAAGLAALHPGRRPEERVDVLVLGYPVVSMLQRPHVGSRDALLGPSATEQQAGEVSLELLVDADAPPTFLFHTADDPSVPAEHSHLLARALGAAGVDHELHVFASGPHGVGLGQGHPTGAWRELARTWLAGHGWGG